MFSTRFPAAHKHKLVVGSNTTKEEINRKLPIHVRWPADNYNHLMEQPTQFYAVAIALALLGVENRMDVWYGRSGKVNG